MNNWPVRVEPILFQVRSLFYVEYTIDDSLRLPDKTRGTQREFFFLIIKFIIYEKYNIDLLRVPVNDDHTAAKWKSQKGRIPPAA